MVSPVTALNVTTTMNVLATHVTPMPTAKIPQVDSNAAVKLDSGPFSIMTHIILVIYISIYIYISRANPCYNGIDNK